MDRRAFLGWLAATMASTAASAASRKAPLLASTHRPFRWQDAESRVEVDQLAISDDGGAFALLVQRPLNAPGAFAGPARPGSTDFRGDLWTLNQELGAPRRLDLGARGAWSPCFSPGGGSLAAMTLVGPGKVGFVIWRLATGEHRLLAEPNADIYAKFRSARLAYAAPSGFFQIPRSYLWLDDTSMLYLDRGSQPQQLELAASSLSTTVRELRERTANGLPSMRLWDADSPTCGVGGRLARIACDTGRVDVLYEGDIRGVSLSPDRRWLAVISATRRLPPTPNEPMPAPLRLTTVGDDPLVEWKLAIVEISQPGKAWEADGITGVGNVAPSRLPVWGADSAHLALPVRRTYSDAPSTGDDAAWEVWPATRRTRQWAASSALDAELVAALLATEGLDTPSVIDGRPQKVRPEDYTTVGQIKGGAWQCAPGRVLFWNAPSLTLFSPAGAVSLPGNFTLVQPTVLDDSLGRTLAVEADGKTSILTTSAQGFHFDKLALRDGWALLGIRPKDATVIYKDDADSGTFLRIAAPGRQPRTSPLSFNTYFREVIRPHGRVLTLKFPDGSERTGVLQLPIGHRPGERHPVVVYAYPNSVPSLNDSLTRPNGYISIIYPAQYLLTKGFAFFHAPFPVGGKSSLEPLRAAVEAVLPWLDVLGRQPEILPGEYGFWGHSNAGYVALALEALTQRFKVIVAWDTFPQLGFNVLHSYAADVALDCAGGLIQSWRLFYEDPRQPYTPQPVPPWKDPAEYIRNEPLFNLNRASTPLLLLEGELDAAPREMEEVYSILYGRGVPVELAYYWGEGHVFASPGNIHDSWLRTEGFFKKYLRMR